MKINFTTTTILNDILTSNNILPAEYRPAYDGKSIGLDLYNAGPDITILPAGVDMRIDPLSQTVFAHLIDVDLESDILERSKARQVKHIKNTYKKLIPTGVRLALPNEWVALIQERGSITKTPLKVRAGVIDPDYTGEVFVNCVNLSGTPYEIASGAKLPFQIIVLQASVAYNHVTESEYETLTTNSTRGAGMIGSSD